MVGIRFRNLFNFNASNIPNCYFFTMYVVSVSRKISIQCHSKLIMVPYHKPLDPMMDIYGGQTIDLKKRVYIWMRMDVVLVEYEIYVFGVHALC